MKPIRKNELEYLDKLIKDKFQDRSREIQSAIEAETQKQTEKNYKSFVQKLGISKQINAFKEASTKLRNFITSKESYEDKLKRAEYKAREALIEKLQSWAKIRDWNERSFDDIKQYDDVEGELKQVCAFETKRAVKKLPKFKVKDELEFLEEQAKNVLYSGRDIMEVWKYLGSTFDKSGIPVAAPKSFLQIESK